MRMKEGKMLDLVQRALQKYDKVFLVTHLSSQEEWRRFCTVLQTLKEEHIDDRSVFMIEEGINHPEYMNSIVLSHEWAMKLYKLYLTYEFSDCFTIFSDCKQYGTIFHYVNTGIMTEKEAVRTLFV